jgi:CBS domain-containing protein
LSRETFRRTLRGRSSLPSKAKFPKKRKDEILRVAETSVVTMAPTTSIYDSIKIMASEGFRRIPIVNPGTKVLEGIVTATDIIAYLGGGKSFDLIQLRSGGNFFKAINEPIRLIMVKKVVSIKTSANIAEAIQLMTQKNLGGLPVVDDEKHVKAIITERDITNMLANRMSGITVAKLMSDKLVTALPTTTIFEAEKTMTTQGFRRLPIVSKGKVIGIITSMDIIRFFGAGKVFTYLRSGNIIQVLNTPALEVATKQVATVASDADVGQAAKVMHEKNIGALPVVKNGNLVGIVTERDFFKILK